MRATFQTQTKTSSSTPPAFTPVRSGLLQRKCACGGPTGECEACREKREPGTLPRAADHRSSLSPHRCEVPLIVHEVLRSPGQPLDNSMRAFMEPRFGHDFSQVRIHTDAKAAESARAVNALAYTVGRNVVFGAGQYEPATNDGRQVLAHELTHVVQQGTGVRPFRVDAAHDAYEREADRAARSILDGERSEISHQRISPQIQRLQQPLTLASPRNPCPNSVRLGHSRQYNHDNISSAKRERYRTYLSNIATMVVGPGPNHSGHCMQELVILVSNSCPAALTAASSPCSGHDCLPVTDPTSFVDGHVTHSARSFLEGTGVNSCSVVCEQRYFCDSLIGPPAAGVFRITRNYQAGTYTKSDGSIVHITTGTIDKTEAPGRPAPSPGFHQAPLQDAPERTLPEGMEFA
jgi:uncharacterized protein DUF4157